MTFVAALAESVGLQILLQPSSTNVVFRAACSVVGTVYPVYASLKAIEAPLEEHPRRDAQWLLYWSIYGSFTLLEQHASKLVTWFPWWWQTKLAFLLWLQLPTFQGARRLYLRFVRPLLLKHQPAIDDTLNSLHETLVRPELVSIGHSARKAALSVPLLGWFARTPAEDEALLRQEAAAMRRRGGQAGRRGAAQALPPSPPRSAPRRPAEAPAGGEHGQWGSGSSGGSGAWDHVDDAEGRHHGGEADGSGGGGGSWHAGEGVVGKAPPMQQSWGQRFWAGSGR